MPDSSNQDVKETYVITPETPITNPRFRSMPLHVLISEKALQFRDKSAFHLKGQSITYRQLNERSNRLARFLIDQGVRKGDRVGVAMERSLNMPVALLAILKTGAAYVPFDPEFPKKRIEFMLEDSGAARLLTSGKYSHFFVEKEKEIVLEEALAVLGDYEASDPGIKVEASDLVYILYTSGSTGRPKGVMVEHHSLTNLLYSMQVMPGIQESDKVLALTTIGFDIAAVELFLPLITGAETVIVSREVGRDGPALLELVRSERITFMQSTPATWKMMLSAGWDSMLEMKAICTGEEMPRQLAEILNGRCLSYYNMYGPTETTVYSTGTQIYPGEERITIGRPILHTQVYIMDNELGELPDGEVGEICIGGDGVSRGYLNLDALTAEKFVDDPFAAEPGAKMFRTGDLGRKLAQGNIQFLGREDHQIKVRGQRIELGEIEYNLVNLDGIAEAVVMLREDRPDDQQLIAYIVAEDPVLSKAQVAEWKQALKRELPAYMVPPALVLVDEMPLTSSGKVDRKALAASPHKTWIDSKGNPPRTDMEKLVAGVWRQVLGLKEVDLDDDFFELGGHSLIAVEMMVELEEKTGKKLPMAALFEAPTVEKLSILLGAQGRRAPRSLVPIKPSGSKPPLYIVHGIGLTVMVFHSLARNLDPDQPVYGIQARGLDGEEEPLDNMEDIAAQYVSEIMGHNPDGPYYLVGYSLGGLIVFEMVKQLRAKGKEIKLLALFDTYAGDTHPSDPWMTQFVKKIKRQPYKVGFILGTIFQEPGKAFRYQGLVAKVRTRQLLAALRLVKKDETTEDNGAFPSRIAAALKHARDRYDLTVNEDDVIELFRVRDRIYFINDPIYLGWKPYAKKGIRIVETAGDHKTFLQPPHDKELARQLQRLLDERQV
jgi:amino acid adenylation domain-containing protein